MRVQTIEHLRAICILLLRSPKHAMRRASFQRLINDHPRDSFSYRLVQHLIDDGYFTAQPFGDSVLYILKKDQLFQDLSQEPFFDLFLEVLQDQNKVVLI